MDQKRCRRVVAHPVLTLDNFGYTSTTQTVESGGREFESLRAHQRFQLFKLTAPF
jgi:hypothetical protein